MSWKFRRPLEEGKVGLEGIGVGEGFGRSGEVWDGACAALCDIALCGD